MNLKISLINRPHIIELITNIKNNQYLFKHIKIHNEDNIIKILFSSPGFCTESYITIQCYYRSNIPINDIFITGTDDNLITKERIWTLQLLNLKYWEYISWLNDKSTKFIISNKSGEYENINLNGLELRLKTNQWSQYLPSKYGYEILTTKINEQL